MIWGMEGRDPMEGDEIRAAFAGEDLDELEPPENTLLNEVIEFFKCEDLLPFAYRILWLSAVKEAVGYIPNYIPLDYEELRGLVVLEEERGKKLASDHYRMKQETDRTRTQSASLQSAVNVTKYRKR